MQSTQQMFQSTQQAVQSNTQAISKLETQMDQLANTVAEREKWFTTRKRTNRYGRSSSSEVDPMRNAKKKRKITQINLTLT